MLIHNIYHKLKQRETIYCIIRIISRVSHRDKRFSHDVAMWDMNADQLTLEHGGKYNDGSIIYIIREQGNGYGFFAEFKSMLCELLFADSLGLKPTVYYGEEYAYYEEQREKISNNAFSYYFRMKETIFNAYESRNVVYSKSCHVEYIGNIYRGIGYSSSEIFEETLAYVYQKYVEILPDLEYEFNEIIQNMFQGRKILGIHYRGTDFKQGYNGHPRVTQFDQIIEAIKKALKEIQFDYIFLATDDMEAYYKFQAEFGARVKSYEDVYRSDAEVSVAFSKSSRKDHHYLLGKEVLRDAYTLSKCHGMISGVSQVSFGARIFKKSRNEKYEYLKIIDNGINKSNKEFKI